VELQLPGVARADLEPVGEEEQHAYRQHPQRAAAAEDVRHRRGDDDQRDQQEQGGIETVHRDRVDIAGEEHPGQHRLRQHHEKVHGDHQPQRPERRPGPARPNGGVVTGRYAIARFNLEAVGRPSHAGARLAEGRSAIRIMAEMIPQIESMTTDACTFSVGVIHGGQWVNCVSSACDGEALSMAKRQADLDRGVERMLALSGTANDVSFKVTRGVTRPVWEPDAGTMALYEKARGLAKQLGAELPHGSAGGGSDGNFTGAMGIPTLDGLGVRGADAHTLNEHIEVESLAERGRLMAGLLATLE